MQPPALACSRSTGLAQRMWGSTTEESRSTDRLLYLAAIRDDRRQRGQRQDGLRRLLREWGGWGSNPRPADYESSMPTDVDNGIYLRKCETDYRCQFRSGRVF